jgi:hypothetical protein
MSADPDAAASVPAIGTTLRDRLVEACIPAARGLVRLKERVKAARGGPPPADPVFAISLREGVSPATLEPLGPEPVLTASDVTDVPAAFVADPFMIQRDDGWHMFFEVLRADTGKGVIGHAHAPDGRAWRYDRLVLEEPFHLSYPYVFEHDGSVFMVPEGGASLRVRLYRADPFPHRWVPVATLLRGARFSDATLLQREGAWWMFVEVSPWWAASRNETLRLYRAEAPWGPWQEHPASPIVRADPESARPAGRPVEVDGGLVRFAQSCRPHYGTRVRAFEVRTLTASAYGEGPPVDRPDLGPSGAGWNAGGMHHVDAHRIGPDRWLACVDGWYDPSEEASRSSDQARPVDGAASTGVTPAAPTAGTPGTASADRSR